MSSTPLPLVINALGTLDNPNLQFAPGAADRAKLAYGNSAAGVDARSLADALASGLTAVNITLGHVAGSDDPFETTVRDIASWDALIRSHGEQLRKVHVGADIAAARAARQIGVIYGFQNTEMLGTQLERVRLFADLGVRVIQLTYNGRNQVGDGATVADDRGLSAFGREVVEALQQQGVLVDLSHSSERSCLAALDLARRPLAITHSGCRAVADHPRNKSDAELRRLAEGGGVIGIYWMPYLRLQGQPLAADLIAHLEHAIDVCGEDHVGIGTDGCVSAIDDRDAYRRHLEAEVETRRRLGIGAPGETAEVSLFLPDLCGPGQFARLAELLAARGHGEARIAKLLGGNFARLFNETLTKTP
ncbi:dipeptidase [Roseateles violae]|uniref:Membrane dipeptidase n=1 Tax=Roseateles violae TaxID=3058042 RepID=A0ABT8DYY3_9BURK|nr:membrane dipeptidase [Pelomonas sp. PFR6]MDN3922780.1 membrane dipeptidase [Pelomonas sp. PFR6]